MPTIKEVADSMLAWGAGGLTDDELSEFHGSSLIGERTEPAAAYLVAEYGEKLTKIVVGRFDVRRRQPANIWLYLLLAYEAEYSRAEIQELAVTQLALNADGESAVFLLSCLLYLRGSRQTPCFNYLTGVLHDRGISQRRRLDSVDATFIDELLFRFMNVPRGAETHGEVLESVPCVKQPPCFMEANGYVIPALLAAPEIAIPMLLALVHVEELPVSIRAARVILAMMRYLPVVGRESFTPLFEGLVPNGNDRRFNLSLLYTSGHRASAPGLTYSFLAHLATIFVEAAPEGITALLESKMDRDFADIFWRLIGAVLAETENRKKRRVSTAVLGQIEKHNYSGSQMTAAVRIVARVDPNSGLVDTLAEKAAFLVGDSDERMSEALAATKHLLVIDLDAGTSDAFMSIQSYATRRRRANTEDASPTRLRRVEPTSIEDFKKFEHEA